MTEAIMDNHLSFISILAKSTEVTCVGYEGNTQGPFFTPLARMMSPEGLDGTLVMSPDQSGKVELLVLAPEPEEARWLHERLVAWRSSLAPGAIILVHGTNDVVLSLVVEKWHEKQEEASTILSIVEGDGISVVQFLGVEKYVESLERARSAQEIS